MKRNTLILITSHFPFGSRETYIETEIKYMSDKFDNIIIISNDTTSKTCREISREIKVIRFSDQLSFIERLISLKYLFSKNFYEELVVIKSIYKQPVKLIIIKTLLVALQTGYKTAQFIKNVLKKEDIIGTNLFLYSYWFSNMAYGIARFKRQYPDVVALTRAHGWDVYFERHHSNYLPMRKHIIDALDAVFFVSDNGKQYLVSKLNNVENEKRLKVSRLGVGEIAKYEPALSTNRLKSKLERIKIISCSNIILLKRVDLIIKTLAGIQDYDIEWVHIGDGKERRALESLALKLLGRKANIIYKFSGKIANENVMEFYKNKNFDIFINLSEFEGIPVTIMEAMSFGIPVIAADVGGVSEIVTDETGVLLPPNPEIEEIKSAIDKFYYMDERTFNTYRGNAYYTWKNDYNAEKNYSDFAQEILNL